MNFATRARLVSTRPRAKNARECNSTYPRFRPPLGRAQVILSGFKRAYFRLYLFPMQTRNSPQKLVDGARVRAFREQQEMTPREFGIALGYHPNYIRAVECGALAVSGIFQTKFLRLERETYSAAAHAKQIRSKYPLPRDVLILARPRRCEGCKRHVILPYANQKYCDAACRARANSKRKEVSK